ncbi:uncharacterized protein JCM15063_004458 [Sporobolomyces koalae]|uniref:uncharacterized protein n=1 Tax=Sporobolomyces koalae TaxID=500713 RepID=UPI003173261B
MAPDHDVPSEALPDLDLLRPRLAQVITSISTLTGHLLHTLHACPPQSTVPPTLPFSDLLNRYSLLIAQVTSLVGLVSSQIDLERDRDRPASSSDPTRASTTKRRQVERDTKRDKWGSVAIVPREPVEESRDWIVGLLLRTKQTPQVEQAQKELVDQLDKSRGQDFLNAHIKLVNTAFDRINAAKEISDEGDEWDWKGRVGLQDEQEDDDDDDDQDKDDDGDGDAKMQLDTNKNSDNNKGDETGAREPWTREQTLAFMRTGKLPS